MRAFGVYLKHVSFLDASYVSCLNTAHALNSHVPAARVAPGAGDACRRFAVVDAELAAGKSPGACTAVGSARQSQAVGPSRKHERENFSPVCVRSWCIRIQATQLLTASCYSITLKGSSRGYKTDFKGSRSFTGIVKVHY